MAQAKSMLMRMVQQGFATRTADPLVVHDAVGKSVEMEFAIQELNKKEHIFYPSRLSSPQLFGGHAQTILTEIKDEYVSQRLPVLECVYDEEEVFELSDGGRILLSFKFHRDKEGRRTHSDVLFCFTGQVGCNQSLYVKNIVKEAAEKRDFDVVVVSWRGRSGVSLVTPKLHNAQSVEDIIEPITHLCKNRFGISRKENSPRRAYAIGCSMGAMVLANALGTQGDDSLLSGAVCVQAAIKKWEGIDYFANSLGGIYNRSMGKYQWNYLKQNMDILGPHFMSQYGIDLAKQLEETEPSYGAYHSLVTVPQNGYESVEDYLRKAAPYDRIGMIKRPTLFLNAKNDAFMGDVVLDYDVFQKNENVVLATNDTAGHVGYHERTFSLNQWFPAPCLDFLDAIRVY